MLQSGFLLRRKAASHFLTKYDAAQHFTMRINLL